MAAPQTASFSEYVLLLSPTETGTYTAYCGLTERSVTITPEFGETVNVDCEDEDKPAWTERDALSYSGEINGEGVMIAQATDPIEEALFAGAKLWMRLVLRRRPVTGTVWTEVKRYAGRCVVGPLGNTATRGEKVTRSINLLNDGPWTRTVAA